MPSDEEAGERILTLFKEQKARPGHILNDHFKRFPKGQFELSDFKPGSEHAIKQGWITQNEQHQYMLTLEGFSRLSSV